MNNKVKEHFSRVAIKNVFLDNPEYLCNRLFEGRWDKMYDYIVDKMGDYCVTQFPDPDWTDITTDWTDEDYDEHSIYVSEHWACYQMGYALQQAFDDNYYAVKYALKCGITLEDFQ